MFQSYFTVLPFSSQQEKQYDQTEIKVKFLLHFASSPAYHNVQKGRRQWTVLWRRSGIIVTYRFSLSQVYEGEHYLMPDLSKTLSSTLIEVPTT